uniref:TonB-dependent receptor n=2 Tax=unclassified Prevotella TaxID=2638335 RepID=A0AB33IV57_9BACT
MIKHPNDLIRRGIVGASLLFSVLGMQAQITMRVQNKTLKEALQQIEKESGYSVFYSNKLTGLDKKVSITAKNERVEHVLDQLLRSTSISYSIEGGQQIVLKMRQKKAAPTSISKTKKTVKGQVTDVNGEPLIGVSVGVEGNTAGAVTDLDGRFQLLAAVGSTLKFSYVGFQSQTQRVTNADNYTIVLASDDKLLDEVVVVGYGAMKKRDLTGAVSSVKGNDIALPGVASAAHALAGKAAGLYVRQNSAQPGGGLDILIRGAGSVNANNDPLYVVDGFPIAKIDQGKGTNARMDPGTQGVLNFINPNDIESIEVLKDASATAIYGARAANGVVIVTTKRGKEGRVNVNYNYNYSHQQFTDNYDVLSLKEWMQEKNKSTWEYWIWENQVGPWGKRTLEEALAAPVNGQGYTRPFTDADIAAAGDGTDWVGLITRNGHIQEHNLSIQGGSKDTQYMVSFNYYDNVGIIRNSGMTRYTVKSNIDQRFLNIFKTGMNLTLSRINNDNTQLGSEQYEKSGIIRSAVQMGPHIKAYDEATGTYPVNPLLGTQPNPYSLLNNIDKGRTDRLLGNVYLEATPISGLLLRLNAGIDRANISRKTYEPKTTLYGKAQQGNADIYTYDNNQYLLEATATYNKTFKDIHKVNFLLGASYENFNFETSNLGNNNFLTDGFTYNNMGAGTGTKLVGSGFTKNKMESYFARAGYILKDRYYFTATMRADGASVFAKNHKWGYFPSMALAWTVSEENFMQSLPKVSLLKLRLSWGKTGNSGIGSNAFASYYAAPAYNRGDGSQIIGVFQGKLENPDLKWETTTEWNAGLDMGFFKNRILLSVEYYHKVISDLLNYKPLNYYHEISRVMANIGKTQSTGIEITLNTKNIDTRNFKWSTDFVFTKYKDRWKERTPDWKPAVFEREDDPIRSIYSRLADHILQIGEEVPAAQPLLKPGEVVIKDLNGYKRDENDQPVVDEKGRFILTGGPDGRIDDADYVLIGSQDPGWLAGMTNTFKYKDFDLGIQLNGMFDRVMQDPTEMAYGLGGGDIARYGYNALRIIKNRWTWDNPSTEYPCSFNAWNTNYTTGDWYYQKAWFVRLSNITLGWNVPQNWLAKTKVISKIRLTMSASNLFCITPYKGLDPETDYYTAAYPNARTYSFGVNISF